MKLKYLLPILLIGTVTGIGAYATMPNDSISRGVYVDSINLSKMSKDSAKKELSKNSDVFDADIKLTAKDHDLITAKAKSMGYRIDINKTVDEAYLYGNEDDLVERAKHRLLSLVNKTVLKPVYTVNPKNYESFMNRLSDDLGVFVSKGSLDVKNGEVIYISPKKGKVIDVDKLQELITNELYSASDNKEPVNVPFTNGIYKSDYNETLKSLNTILGSYTSYFNTAAKGRTHNIYLAADSVDHYLVKPNEVFSFNDIVGERTASRGYEAAPVFVGTELVPGIGGGICQVSSTLFNAALYGGMDIVERVNHIEPVGYMPLGQDATVAYGYIDFAFKNPYENPVYVVVNSIPGALTIYLLGNEVNKPQDVEISNISQEIVPFKKEIKIDDKIMKEKVEPGENGLYVKTRRILVDHDGKSNIYVYNSYYDPINEILYKPTEENLKKQKEIEEKEAKAKLESQKAKSIKNEKDKSKGKLGSDKEKVKDESKNLVETKKFKKLIKVDTSAKKVDKNNREG